MYRVGLSSCGKALNDSLFRDYAQNNVLDMEISETEYDCFDYQKIYSFAQKYGVNLWSLHLPFVSSCDIASCDKDFREKTLAHFNEIICKGAEIGVTKFVVHPCLEPVSDADRTERLLYARQSLSFLADICGKNGAEICVEDLPRTCLGNSIAEMQFLTAEDDRIKICFDTNHITVEKPEDAILTLGDKIITLHVSDFDFVDERHWLPGEGNINWEKVLSALQTINYNGVFMYEIRFGCPKTLSRSRDLTVSDFARNAKEIFTNAPLTLVK